MDYGEVGELDPEVMRNIFGYNEDTILYENGTLELTVKNNGANILYVDKVFADGIAVDFTTSNNNYELDPGETQKYTAQLYGISRNTPVKIKTTAIGPDGYDSASDSGYLIPVYDGAAIEILELDQTSLFTHEQIEIAVRNVGNLEITMEEFRLLGTTIDLTTAESIYGTATIQPLDVFKFSINVTGLVKLNQSDTVDLTVYAESGTVVDTKTLDAELPLGYNFIIDMSSGSDTQAIVSNNTLQLDTVGFSSLYNLTVDAIIVNGTEVSPNDINFVGGNVITPDRHTIITIHETEFGMDIVNGYFYKVTIITEEGPKVTALVEGE
jgi:hypothetical protein